MRYTRERRLAISSDYIIYLQGFEYNIITQNDPESFKEVISCNESNFMVLSYVI